MAHQVFISYSSHDRLIADRVAATLESRGIRCWIAPRDIPAGSEWSESIVEAIDRSEVMVLLFSANSNISPQVQREVERAVHAQCKVLPLRISECNLSQPMEYLVGTRQWLDAVGGPSDEHLEKLIGTLRRLLDWKEPIPAEGRSTGNVVAPKHTRRGIWVAGLLLVALAGGALYGLRHGHQTPAPPAPGNLATPQRVSLPPTTTPAPVENAVVDLMPLIDPALDGRFGENWSKIAQGLQSPSQGSKLRIPYQPPEEYDFRVEFTVVNPKDTEAIFQNFVHGESAGAWVLQRDNWAGFELDGGRLADEGGNPTRVEIRKTLTDGKPHRSELRVRRDGISAYVDGELLCQRAGWNGLSENPLRSIGDRTLGVGVLKSVGVVFHKIEVVEVRGKGKPAARPAGARRLVHRVGPFPSGLGWNALGFAGDELLCASAEKQFALCSASDGSKLLSARQTVRAISAGPQGQFMVGFESPNNAHVLSVFDLKSRNKIGSVPTDEDFRATISPDQRQLAVAMVRSGAVQLFDITSEGLHPTRQISTTAGYYSGIHYSHDGSRLLLHGNQTPAMRMLDSHTLEEIWNSENEGSLKVPICPGAAFSLDDKQLLMYPVNEVVLLDASTGKVTGRIRPATGVRAAYSRAIYSPDGQRVLCWWLLGGSPQRLLLRNASDASDAVAFSDPIPEVHAAAFTPDGKRIVAGCADGTLWLLDASSGKVLEQFGGDGGQVVMLDISPNGQLLAVANGNRHVRTYSLAIEAPAATGPASRP